MFNQIIKLFIFSVICINSILADDHLQSKVNVLRIREKPNTNSKIIENINKSTILVLKSKTNIVENIHGLIAEWIQVENKHTKNIGYVFGGYVQKLNKAQSPFVKCQIKSDGITVFLAKNNTIILKNIKPNDEDGMDQVTYETCIYVPQLNSVFIKKTVYEGGYSTLYSLIDGQNFHIWGPPVFSPDNTLFACISSDIEAGYFPNGIQIYSSKFPKSLIYEHKFKADDTTNDFQPLSINWKSNELIELKMENYDSKIFKIETIFYKNGIWNLKK